MPSGALPKMDLSAMPVRAKYTPVRPMATTHDHPDGTGLVTPATKVRNSEMNRANGGKAASASRAMMVSAAVDGSDLDDALDLVQATRVW